MDIRISLDLTKSHQKYIHVSYSISNISSDDLVLSFPTWSPGSYLIREYQSQVESFDVTDTKKKKLKFQKISKCQWQINTKNCSRILLSYRVYANDLNVRGVYSDHEFVFINPTSAFFFLDGALQLPADLSIKIPNRWSLAIVKRAKGKTYSFQNFDELFDTPIMCAKELKTAKFTVKNTQYKMAFWGHHTGDLDKIAQHTQEIVSKQLKIYKENPCKEYLFQVLFAPRLFGGLEHSHSSTNLFDGSMLSNPKDYKRFLSLLSHEHFHLWNVKRIRPRELGPFDYIKEMYTRDLWMAEGITSYFDDHVVMRTGIASTDDYLSLLSDNITKLEANKAAKVNTLSESSYDAWIKYYRQNENSLNTVVSYYLKGGLVMLLLDFRVINYTKGKYNFDDVMRRLYKIYKKRPEVGFTREEFLEVVEAISKKSFVKFFTDYVDGVKPIDWKKEFEAFGIEVKKSKKGSHKYMGVILSQNNGKVIIKNIAEDSPAYNSILQPSDEIIAIDDNRLESLAQFDHYLLQDKICILLSRLGRVMEAEIKLNDQSLPAYILKIKQKLRQTQRRNLSRFLRKQA